MLQGVHSRTGHKGRITIAHLHFEQAGVVMVRPSSSTIENEQLAETEKAEKGLDVSGVGDVSTVGGEGGISVEGNTMHLGSGFLVVIVLLGVGGVVNKLLAAEKLRKMMAERSSIHGARWHNKLRPQV
jgi:hypothetical protein